MKKTIYFILIILLFSYSLNPKISFCKDRRMCDEHPTVSPTNDVNNPYSKDLTGEFWGFLIGIKDYKYWDDLETPVNDVKKIYDILIHKYGFLEKNIVMLINEEATRERILNEFKELTEKIKEDDNLFFYFAGHGHQDSNLEIGYWVPYDTKIGDISSPISNPYIRELIKRAKYKCRHIFLVSDSCFSGTLLQLRSDNKPPHGKIDPASIIDRAKIDSCQVLTSGHDEPVSDDGFGGHSVFAYFFIKELEENEEPYITSYDIFKEIQVPVIDKSPVRQKPLFKSLLEIDLGGDFIFYDHSYNGISYNIEAKNNETQKLQKEIEKLWQGNSESEKILKNFQKDIDNTIEHHKEIEEIYRLNKNLEKQIKNFLKDSDAPIEQQIEIIDDLCQENRKLEEEIKNFQKDADVLIEQQKEIDELCQENRKLEEEIENLQKNTYDTSEQQKIIEKLWQQNKKLTEEIIRIQENGYEKSEQQKIIWKLSQQNKKLGELINIIQKNKKNNTKVRDAITKLLGRIIGEGVNEPIHSPDTSPGGGDNSNEETESMSIPTPSL